MNKSAIKIISILFLIVICVSIFTACSSSAPEDEIIGTWEWTHDIDFGEDIGTVHNFEKYVFEKKGGKYLATYTFSGLSSPLTLEYSYEVKESKLILTLLSNTSKTISHDIIIEKDLLKIGEKEYKKIN